MGRIGTTILTEDILLLAQDGGKTTNLSPEGRTDVLRAVRHQVLNGANNVVEDGRLVDQSAEAGDLTGNGRPHFGLVVLQQLHESGNQVPSNNFFVNRLGNLSSVLVQNSPPRRGNEAQHAFSNLSAIMYRTLQLLSSIKLRSDVRSTP